jgi:UTP-glucose-1-phosphate uridylyltransferase
MDHPKRVRKAVLPVAGLGTRFLPATKAMPKEMLPVVDKPLIQYAVEECIASGIENIIFVTGRRKNAIEDHFDSAPSGFSKSAASRIKRKWCVKSAAGCISVIRGRAKRWGLDMPC